MTMKPYLIRQGEYVTQLAAELGFDADEVWNDDKNESLRKKRPNRDVLAPGDVLWVPVTEPKQLDLTAGDSNHYTATLPTVTVTMVLKQRGEVLANEDYTIWGIGLKEKSGQSDGDGKVEIKVSVRVKEVHLSVPKRGAYQVVRVGHLDPIDTDSGVEQRLRSLGYYGGKSELLPKLPDADAAALAERAIKAFQAANELTASGAADQATRDKLVEKYGS